MCIDCEHKTDPIHPDHIGQLVLDNMDVDPDHVLQIDARTGEGETRRSLKTRSIRFARYMLKLGLKTGDIVTVCAHNHNDTQLPVMSGFYIGVAVNGIDMKMSRVEYVHLVGIVEPKMIFCELEKAELFHEIIKELGYTTRIAVFAKTDDKRFIPVPDFYKDTSRDSEEFKVCNFDPKKTLAYIICSSGSTGLPKGTCHTHSTAILHSRGIKKLFEGYVMLQFSSLYWLSGIAMTLLNLTISTTKINTPPFTIELFFEYVPKYRGNLLMVTPSVVRMLLNHPDIDSLDLSSMRMFMVAGSTIDFDEMLRMQKYIKQGQIVNSYGLSEMGGPVSYTTVDMEVRRGCCGKLIPYYENKIVCVETGKVLTEPNAIGELYLRAPCMMTHYLNNPEATKDTINEEGWLLTGDLVRIDEDGYVYIVERLKEVFKVNGFNCTPAVIEGVINKIPGIAESAIIGIDCEVLGSIPIAFVKRAPGSTVTAQHIKDVVLEKCASYMELRGGVIFVDQFEMTPSGKLKRNVLKDIIPNAKIE